MLKGSCLCGGVTFSIDGELGPISHCHCKTCRKAHAAAFGTVARVKNEALKIETGQDLLSTYKASEHKTRFFCSQCGAQIYAVFQGQDESVIRLGVLDDAPQAKPSRHIFVDEKATWYEIDDSLPQFSQWPK